MVVWDLAALCLGSGSVGTEWGPEVPSSIRNAVSSLPRLGHSEIALQFAMAPTDVSWEKIQGLVTLNPNHLLKEGCHAEDNPDKSTQTGSSVLQFVRRVEGVWKEVSKQDGRHSEIIVSFPMHLMHLLWLALLVHHHWVHGHLLINHCSKRIIQLKRIEKLRDINTEEGEGRRKVRFSNFLKLGHIGTAQKPNWEVLSFQYLRKQLPSSSKYAGCVWGGAGVGWDGLHSLTQELSSMTHLPLQPGQKGTWVVVQLSVGTY